jgi:hypothetical protein
MSADEILRNAEYAANHATTIAIAWHALLAGALLAVAAGAHPSCRAVRLVLVAPLVSVAAVAFVFGNPFNGVVFAAASTLLAVLALRPDRGDLTVRWDWRIVAGIAVLAYGWAYPHFLEGPATAYLYAAPLGVLPCPTLATIIGMTILGGGLSSRRWSYALATVGLVYGVVGVAYLGVTLDLALIAAAVALAFAARHAHEDLATGRGIGQPADRPGLQCL